MTIHDLGYRTLEYRPTATVTRLLTLARVELRAVFRSRRGVALFCLCLLPAVVSAVILLMQMGVLEIGPDRFREVAFRATPGWINAWSGEFYLEPPVRGFSSRLPFLVLTAWVTVRSIPRDRVAGALELLWTRGITPRGYVLARWAGSFGLLALPCVLAPLVLWVLGLLTAPDDSAFFASTAPFVPGVLAGLVVFTAVLTALAVLLSAVPARPNAAAVLWVVTILGTATLARVMTELVPALPAAAAVSPWYAGERLVEAIAGVPSRWGFGAGTAAASLALWLAAAGALAARRLRLREALA